MSNTVTVAEAALAARVQERLLEAGSIEPQARAATRAMMHASLHGIDSHGVRLAAHYAQVMRGGRVKRDPVLKVERRAAAAAIVDADDGLGHYASYKAIEVGGEIARETGIAAVGVTHSSHHGASGAYALAGAEAGFVSFATTNTDSMVALHGGAARFHGTNPLAFAAPVPDSRPWLFDMATSSIPMNRVLLYRSLGRELPEGVAADRHGVPTTDPHATEMLIPLGGVDFGHKGAGLAGVATLFTALLLGTTLDADFIGMTDTSNMHTPRNMGHFFLVIDQEKFAGSAAFGASMVRYLKSLREAPARPGETLMAPGDREWMVAEERRRDGIPIDIDTAGFLGFR